jgi:predicted nucleic acid-binding protein
MTHPSDCIVVDADGLIALFDAADTHSTEAVAVLNKIDAIGAALLYPTTMIAEAVTTLQRKLHNQAAVIHIMRRLDAKEFNLVEVDAAIIDEAARLFHPGGSKQNTLFDAIVAAVAKQRNARAIFSFDQWYPKIGLPLAQTLI